MRIEKLNGERFGDAPALLGRMTIGTGIEAQFTIGELRKTVRGSWRNEIAPLRDCRYADFKRRRDCGGGLVVLENVGLSHAFSIKHA